MADSRAELRRALSIVEGPLRFALKNDHALASLRGFDSIVSRAVQDAQRLALSSIENRIISTISAAAASFDSLGLEERRKAVAIISAELARLAIDARQEPPASEPEKPASKKRVLPLSAEAERAPVSVDLVELTKPL